MPDSQVPTEPGFYRWRFVGPHESNNIPSGVYDAIGGDVVVTILPDKGGGLSGLLPYSAVRRPLGYFKSNGEWGERIPSNEELAEMRLTLRTLIALGVKIVERPQPQETTDGS